MLVEKQNYNIHNQQNVTQIITTVLLQLFFIELKVSTFSNRLFVEINTQADKNHKLCLD